ncbi:hypothetical protein LzC2_32520 [Planctomycetes bacterium LzC2]|uniref:Uncharacterized protein n=1 Tax=Alienimonas chondri TaxID=2681879 RepID=A0ABX1VIU8_9PLAN|nr:hypothetical protein [Alienimonas chondri]
MLAGLAIPAGVFGEAYTSFYGLDAYTTYVDPYSGSSTRTVRPFWDVLGVFQRPVGGGTPVVAASYSSPASYQASYSPAVATASYYGGGSYYGGSSYTPVTSHYGGTSSYGDSASYYGGSVVSSGYRSECDGSFYNSGYAGGALPYGSTAGYSTYGSSRSGVTLSDGCRVVPACTPCTDPCGGECSGGDCTSYSPADDRIFESDPEYADPPDSDRLDRVPRRSPDRRDDSPLDPLEPPDFNGSEPTERERPAPRRRAPEDSVRDLPRDDRPTGDPFDDPLDPLDDSDFGGVDDPMTGAGTEFGGDPGTGVRPAEGVAPYTRGGIAAPPDDRARRSPANDDSFPDLEERVRGNFEGSEPLSGAVPGQYGPNPGGIERPATGGAFGGDPGIIGQPGDGSFADEPGARPAFDEGFFPEDDPDFERDTYRLLTPNSIDLTGPPVGQGEAESPENEAEASEDVESQDAEEDAAIPTGLPLSAPKSEVESEAPVVPELEEPESSDSAAAPPRLITAQLLLDDMQRTRLRSRIGRTRIARFRHREAGPRVPTAESDVQIATK